MTLDADNRIVMMELSAEKIKENMDLAHIGLNRAPNRAASCAYYSAFHALQILLLEYETTMTKKRGHRPGVDLFNRDFIHTGVFPKQIGTIYGRLEYTRNVGDYSKEVRLTKLQAAQAISEATIFIDAVLEHVQERRKANNLEPLPFLNDILETPQHIAKNYEIFKNAIDIDKIGFEVALNKLRWMKWESRSEYEYYVPKWFIESGHELTQDQIDYYGPKGIEDYEITLKHEVNVALEKRERERMWAEHQQMLQLQQEQNQTTICQPNQDNQDNTGKNKGENDDHNDNPGGEGGFAGR